MRNRKVKFIGGTYYISLYKQDIEDYDLKHNDLVNIDDIIKCKTIKKRYGIKKEK